MATLDRSIRDVWKKREGVGAREAREGPKGVIHTLGWVGAGSSRPVDGELGEGDNGDRGAGEPELREEGNEGGRVEELVASRIRPP